MKGIICTKHSIMRLKERVGIGKKQANKFVNKIAHKGIHCRELDGWIRRFADKIRLKYDKETYLYLYGNAFYILKKRVLITVLIVPDIIYNDYKHNKLKEDSNEKMDVTSNETL